MKEHVGFLILIHLELNYQAFPSVMLLMNCVYENYGKNKCFFLYLDLFGSKMYT